MLKLLQRLICNLRLNGYSFIDFSELYFGALVTGKVECQQ